MYSPRPWGCFLALKEGVDALKIFPTSVGVFLTSGSPRTARPVPPLDAPPLRA